MRFVQRGGSIPDQSQQQVEVITADSPEAVGVQISTMVARYAIRVVSMIGFTYTDHHVAVVVFEEES